MFNIRTIMFGDAAEFKFLAKDKRKLFLAKICL